MGSFEGASRTVVAWDKDGDIADVGYIRGKMKESPVSSPCYSGVAFFIDS